MALEYGFFLFTEHGFYNLVQFFVQTWFLILVNDCFQLYNSILSFCWRLALSFAVANGCLVLSRTLPKMVSDILFILERRERVLSLHDASEVLRDAFSQTEAAMNDHQYEVFSLIFTIFYANFPWRFLTLCRMYTSYDRDPTFYFIEKSTLKREGWGFSCFVGFFFFFLGGIKFHWQTVRFWLWNPPLIMWDGSSWPVGLALWEELQSRIHWSVPWWFLLSCSVHFVFVDFVYGWWLLSWCILLHPKAIHRQTKTYAYTQRDFRGDQAVHQPNLTLG